MNANWHRSIFHVAEAAKINGLVLYGAGFWGKVGYEIFEKLGVRPLCYCDDAPEKQGGTFQEIPIISPKDAAEKYKTAIFIPCIDETKKTGAYGREKQKKMLSALSALSVHSSHSELRLMYYVFLLDIVSLDDTKYGNEVKDGIKLEQVKKLVLFNNMSNSGSYFLEQLMDNHPHILCLPYSGSMERVYEMRLCYLTGEELLVEMTAQMLGYLHSQYEELECIGQHKMQGFCVDEKGEFIKEAYINPRDFIWQLRKLFGTDIKLDSYGHMLKLYFVAYNNCLNKKYRKDMEYCLFYHMHLPNYDVSTMCNCLKKNEFERIENLIIIREPVQHCFSWIRRFVLKERNEEAVQQHVLSDILGSELGFMLEKRAECENVKAIRFEDLKYQMRETMEALCEWLDIPYTQDMESTTINGRLIYFPALTSEGVKYITGQDTTAVSQVQFSEVLTLWDETRLNMLYHRFKKAYGYECVIPDIMEFDEETRQKILLADFKFCGLIEELIAQFMGEYEVYDVYAFVKELFNHYIKNAQKTIAYYDYIKPKKGGEC